MFQSARRFGKTMAMEMAAFLLVIGSELRPYGRKHPSRHRTGTRCRIKRAAANRYVYAIKGARP